MIVPKLIKITLFILELFQEGSALKYAHSCGQLVMAAGDSVPKEELVELQFRSKAVALLPASVCARHGAGMVLNFIFFEDRVLS